MYIRLHSKPCFLKLCDPGDIGSDSVNMIKGMYLTRQHFEVISARRRHVALAAVASWAR